MPSFRYQSLTAAGEVRQGVVAAATRAAAIRTLGGRGETATQLDALDDSAVATSAGAAGVAAAVAVPEAPAGAPRGTVSRPLRRGLARPVASRSEMANLIRELATALEAGLPVMHALRTVRRQATGRAMAAILDHLIDRVEAGAPLHQAAGEYGPPFDDLIVGMLRAADASGKTTDVLHQLADLLERSLELRREVIGSTLYPMIVAVLVLLSAIILVTVLVPRLIEPLAGEMTLPLPTRILMGVASFLSANWIFCAAAIVATVVGWRMWIALPANRLHVDRLKLQAPLVGRLLRDVAVGR
jgi:type II secretory pathway component PulF